MNSWQATAETCPSNGTPSAGRHAQNSASRESNLVTRLPWTHARHFRFSRCPKTPPTAEKNASSSPRPLRQSTAIANPPRSPIQNRGPSGPEVQAQRISVVFVVLRLPPC